MNAEQLYPPISRREMLGKGLTAAGSLALGSMAIPNLAEAALQTSYGQNRLMVNGQDPSVAISPDKKISYCGVINSTQIAVRQADSIPEMAEQADTPFGEEEIVCDLKTVTKGVATLQDLVAGWAPEVYFDGQQVTIIVTSYNGYAGGGQSACVLKADRLGGDFSLEAILNPVELSDGSNAWANDAEILRFLDTKFIRWSGKLATGGPYDQFDYICEISDNYKLIGTPQIIAAPSRRPEQYYNQAAKSWIGICEAPHTVISAKDPTVFFAQRSVNASWLNRYKIESSVYLGGANGDPTDASQYEDLGVVFAWSPLAPTIISPGSHSTIQDNDGTNWLIYANKKSRSPVWSKKDPLTGEIIDNREVRAQTFEFDQYGAPVYGSPRSTFY